MEKDRLAYIEARLERVEKDLEQTRKSTYLTFFVGCVILFLLFFGPVVAFSIVFLVGILYVSSLLLESVMKTRLGTEEEQEARVKERVLKRSDDLADLNKHGLPWTSTD